MRLGLIFVLSITWLASRANDLLAQDYLTKEGQLTQQLKIVQLQGGFAGFTGVQYTVAPDGSWTAETVFNQKLTPKGKGKLAKSALAKLASLLEKYDVAKLPPKSGKPPGANPHSITITFGNKSASLVGQVPPNPDPNNPTGTVESRFAGLWAGVVGLLKTAPEEPEKGKN